MLQTGIVRNIYEGSELNYLGSKGASGAWQIISASMPPHDTFIETHVGTGQVLRRKIASARTIANDIDPETLRDYPLPAGVEIHNMDAIAFLNILDLRSMGRVLIYADPPYLHCTRTSNKRYRFEYTEKDHIMLLSNLKDLAEAGHMVMVSGYPSALYDDLLTGWRSIEFQAMTRGGVRTEKLWLSFADGAAHWVNLAGKDFTDRQRIKRKAERWAANFASLPQWERQAVLSAIMAQAASDGPEIGQPESDIDEIIYASVTE
ncbi:DNA adenine methylase (plasmid) [Thalassospira sp. SM2505]